MVFQGFEAERGCLKYRCPAAARGVQCTQRDLCNQGRHSPHGRVVRVPLDAARWTRDPVATAEPSERVRQKKHTKRTDDGWPVHSLRTLLADLATRCKNTFRAGEGKTTIRFEQATQATPFQAHVVGLLGLNC